MYSDDIANRILSIALSKGLDRYKKPSVEVIYALPDPTAANGIKANSSVLVAFSQPSTTVANQLWLNADPSSPGYKTFSISDGTTLIPAGTSVSASTDATALSANATLKPATTTLLGGIKVGANLSITVDGTLSAVLTGSATVSSSNITDATATGRSVLTAANAAAVKTLLSLSTSDISGLGSAATQASSAFATAAQGVLAASALQTVSSSSLTDSTPTGRSLITAANAAAAKTVLAINTSDVSGLGSAALQATTAFATAAQGLLAASALQSVSSTTISDASTIGKTILTAANAAAVKTALAISSSDVSGLGTAATASSSSFAPSAITALTAGRAVTVSDLGAVLRNDAATDITLTVNAGAGTFTVMQGATNGITLSAGTGTTAFYGMMATSFDNPIIVVTEITAGVFRADALSIGRGNTYLYHGMVGDSRIASLTTDGSPNYVTKASHNWQNRFFALAGQPGQIVYFGGVSAQRTDQFDARVTLCAQNPLITDVWLKGGINNISQTTYTHAVTGATITAANTGASAATDMIGYIQRCLAAGKRVWIEEDEGADGTWPSATWTAAMSQQLGILNAKVEAYCRGRRNVYFIKWPTIYDRTTATNKHLAGIKYDGIHDSTGGCLVKAQYFQSVYGSLFPTTQYAVIPSSFAYSGDTTNPVSVLDNAGFVTRTTGTLSGTQANFSAWAATTAYVIGNTRVANNYLYYCTVAGTSGSTAPSHTSGTASDGTVTWQYICSWGAWAGTTAVPAKCFRTNGTNVYYSYAGGTTGSTAPTHTSGTASDGGVQWLYVCQTTSSIPANWQANTATGGFYLMGTNLTANNAVEMVVIAFYSAASAVVNILTGSDLNGSFRGRQVLGGVYSPKAVIQIDDHVGLGTSELHWARGDMTNFPRDGYSTSSFWTTTQSLFTNTLGTYPIKETKMIQPFPCDAQSTTNGNTLGTVATWNDVKIQTTGAQPGFAILRITDVSMPRIS